MRERVKTILLFSLVVMSIFLTQKLWIQLPNEVFNVFETSEVLSSSYLLSDMIAPNKYLINFNPENHTLVYDDKYGIWDRSKKNLKGVLESKNVKIENVSRDEYLKLHEERSIVFYFPEKINTYILAKAWDVKNPNSIADTLPNINYIYIYLGNGDPFFVFSGDDKVIKVYEAGEDTHALKDQLIEIEETGEFINYYSARDLKSTGDDIYLPWPESKNSMAVVHVTNELTTLKDIEKTQLAERYLSNKIANIHEIVEANGSSIYVNNQRWLKLNSSGYIEYFNPLEETVRERNLYISLISATEFIDNRTRARKGMYLAKVEEIQVDNSLGYKFTFKYRIRGIPVILGNKEVGEYITMEVFNNHVRSYKHLARKEMDMKLTQVREHRTMLTSFDVIDNNFDLLAERYMQKRNMTIDEFGEGSDLVQEIISSIEDINLSYYDPSLKDKEERLIGVWAIKADGILYAFDAYTGTLVFER